MLFLYIYKLYVQYLGQIKYYLIVTSVVQHYRIVHFTMKSYKYIYITVTIGLSPKPVIKTMKNWPIILSKERNVTKDLELRVSI
jgi:hypothetical protein